VKKIENRSTFAEFMGNYVGGRFYEALCILPSMRYYAPSIIGARGHKAMMLFDVCLSRTSGLSGEQRGLERLKLAQR